MAILIFILPPLPGEGGVGASAKSLVPLCAPHPNLPPAGKELEKHLQTNKYERKQLLNT